MLLGEFEFLTTVDGYEGVDLVLCCVLLVALSLIGTFVLVNLLLALIVSDVEQVGNYFLV